MKTLDAARIVDELGKVKAKIAELQEAEKALRNELVESDLDEADGKLFHASITRTFVTKTDYKTILAETENLLTEPQHKKLDRIVKQNTTEDERVTVKITSR